MAVVVTAIAVMAVVVARIRAVMAVVVARVRGVMPVIVPGIGCVVAMIVARIGRVVAGVVVKAVLVVVPERPERGADVRPDGGPAGRVARIEALPVHTHEPPGGLERNGDVRGALPHGELDLMLQLGFQT